MVMACYVVTPRPKSVTPPPSPKFTKIKISDPPPTPPSKDFPEISPPAPTPPTPPKLEGGGGHAYPEISVKISSSCNESSSDLLER